MATFENQDNLPLVQMWIIFLSKFYIFDWSYDPRYRHKNLPAMLSVAMKADKKFHLRTNKKLEREISCFISNCLAWRAGSATVKLETNLRKLAHMFWTSSYFQRWYSVFKTCAVQKIPSPLRNFRVEKWTGLVFIMPISWIVRTVFVERWKMTARKAISLVVFVIVTLSSFCF